MPSWDLSGLLPVLLEGLRQQDDVWCAWRESVGARLCQRARFQEKGEGGGKVSIRMFLALRRSLSPFILEKELRLFLGASWCEAH